MKIGKRLFALIFYFGLGGWSLVAMALGNSSPVAAINEPLIIATPFSFDSNVLAKKRKFFVHLPPGYQESQTTYPVLYLTDGERKIQRTAAVVDDLSDFAHRIPKMIVVGIATNEDRAGDLKNLPTSRQFLRFITEELKPYIEQYYRTSGDNLLLGSSAGGAFSLLALFEQPEAFNTFIAISPSVFYNNFWLVIKANELAEQGTELNKSLYLSLGNEGISQGVDELAFNLRKSPIKGLKWQFTKVEEESHDSIALKQLYNALQDHYAAWAPPHYRNANDFDQRGGLAGLKQLYSYRPESTLPIATLTELAWMMTDANREQEAIAICQLNIEQHPKETRVYKLLGDIYKQLDQPENALTYYQRALEVAVSNHDGKRIGFYKKLLDEFKLQQAAA